MQQQTTSAVDHAALDDRVDDPPLTHNHDSDSDASSDMDVSESENEPDPDPTPKSPPRHVNGDAPSAGAKRKLGDEITNGSSDSVHALPKKPRLSPSPPAQSSDWRDGPSPPNPDAKMSYIDRLSADLCQRIFSRMPPSDLARCLRVSKKFNTCLTNTRAEPGSVTHHPRVKTGKDKTPVTWARVMDSNDVWASSRKIWCPNLPRPLARYDELQMLQLVGGRDCQSCHTPHNPGAPVTATSVYNPGPGPDGVRVIWPFGLRMCGCCLRASTMTDIALLKTPSASLRTGLPFIFLTSDLNFIPEGQMPAFRGAPNPPGVITKAYYVKDVDIISAELENAKSLASEEEWRKGLVTKGKDAMADAARWEKWEAQLRPSSDLRLVLREYDLSSSLNHVVKAQRRSTTDQYQPPAIMGNGSSSTYALPPAPNFAPSFQSSPPGPPFQYGSFPTTTGSGVMQSRPANQHPSKHVKQPHDVEERLQARRREIERRCLELPEPIEANVLQYMDSFVAATKIAQPLTDQAWDMLKPRILQQREEAELVAHRRMQDLAALQATARHNGAHDAYLNKPAKEVYDKEYDLAQAPFRKRMVEYVDEYVNASWNGNPVLDRDTSPVFAARAILHAQQRYKEDLAVGRLPAHVRTNKTTHRDGSPFSEPIFSLDNVKWLFENKIRGYLHPSCRELFLCAGCLEDSPDNVKWFAFESLIQHYGAKHTTAFSKGNVTVHWQISEWPVESPFHPNPEKFIRPSNRKSSGFRGRGNARSTPQARHNGPFSAPGAGKPLSDNAYVSNPQGSYNAFYDGAQGFGSSSYGQSNHQAAPYGPPQGLSQAAQQLEADPDGFDGNKVNQLAADALEIWGALEGVSGKEFLTCVRIQTVFFHANNRFLDKYRTPPTLDHYTEAFAMNTGMHPIKTAAGLACKSCVANQTDGSASYQSYFARVRNAKLYSTSALITHFMITHMQHIQFSAGMRDMLELPEAQLIKDLVHADGMDDTKLALVVAAFPQAFPNPNVKIEDLRQPSGTGARNGATVRAKGAESSGKKSKKKKGKRGGSGTPSGRAGSQEVPHPAPQEHEYDPRKPMASTEQDEEEYDASKFDTDVARKNAPSSAAAATPHALNLLPETLRALQSISGLASAQPVQKDLGDDARLERAPSVGRDDYPAQPPPAPAPPRSSNGQPDIAAILASLTGGLSQQSQLQQVSTPTPGRGSRDASISRSAQRDSGGVDQLYRSLSTAHPHDRVAALPYPAYAAAPPAPAHSQPYQPQQPAHYRPSVEPATPSPRYEAPGQDLQAALERNARHFVQNQSQNQAPSNSHAYAAPPEPPYPPHAYTQASPPQQQHAQTHISPPRYRYAYDEHYAPVQGQPAPIQYIQLPPQPQHQQATPVYGQPAAYQPQQQRLVYYDEHGRELVPVEATPPQAQYAGYGGQGQGHYGHGQGQGSPPQLQPQGLQIGAQQGYYGGQYGGGR